MQQRQIAYISFDIVPAPKGAAIHIAAFAQALASAFGKIELVTVSPTVETICRELYPNVKQTALPAIGDNLINRVLHFQTLLGEWVQGRCYDIIHFRSIYEGFPLALNKQKICHKFIFEVNGLPSIELKYRYPAVADDRELLYKLKKQEQICLESADLIITPSAITKSYLQTIAISPAKIKIIPNGVNLGIFTYLMSQFSLPFKMLYFGTFSAWQGVHLAIEALGLINRDFPAELTVIGWGRDRQLLALKQLAQKKQIENKLKVLKPLSQQDLVKHIHQADVILAPLTANDRNLVQGCCPLKVLESMATGTPVIASDLPVVRELGVNEEHFLLVKPNSAKAIKDGVLRLRNEPELARKIAINARQQVEHYYTWEKAGAALIKAYHNIEQV